MAKYFDFNELIRSETARARGIDNTPPPEAVKRLGVLAERLLDPVRELWGAPLRVNSGYRSPALNAAVGGTAASQHLRGEAADITTGSQEGNRRLFEMIVAAAAGSEGGCKSSQSRSLRVELCKFNYTASASDGAVQDDATAEAKIPATVLEFDQLIDENNYSWLHLSYREGNNRRRILHL